MAGDDPLPAISHGQSGYQKHGCRCAVCRRGKADAQSRFRAKRRGEVQDPVQGGGELELLTRAVIRGCGEMDEAGKTLAMLAIMHAQLLDSFWKSGRWHLLSATTRNYRVLMRELAALSPAGRGEAEGEDDDDDPTKNARGFGVIHWLPNGSGED